MVKLYVSKGNLEILVPEGLTTNAINAYEVEFSFAEDWDGFSRNAIFYQTQRGKRYSVLLTDNKAIIPAEILQVNLPVYVGMVGEKDDVKKTTKFVKLEIDEGADSKSTSSFVQTVDEKIAFIRLNHGVFEYSTDGNTWAQIKAEASEKTHFFIDNKKVPEESYGIALETDETLDFNTTDKKLGLSPEYKAETSAKDQAVTAELEILHSTDESIQTILDGLSEKTDDLEIQVVAAADGIKKVTTNAKHANDKADKNTALIEKLDNEKFNKNGGAIDGNVSISGDLTVKGTTTTEHASQLFVDKPIIAVNGKKVNLQTVLAGLAINKDENATYGLVYDATTDTVRFGIGTLDENEDFRFNDGEGMPLAIRADSADFTDLHLVRWDATKKAFVDAGVTVADIQADMQADFAQKIEERLNDKQVNRMELVENISGEHRDGVGITVQGNGEIQFADGTTDTFAGEIDIPLFADKEDIALENKDEQVVIKGVEYIEITDGNGTLSDEAYTRLTAKKGNAIIFKNEIYRLVYNASTEKSWVYSAVGGSTDVQYIRLLTINTSTKKITFTEKEIGADGVETMQKGTGLNAEVFNGLAPENASGESSHAEGVNSKAQGKGAHAEGADTYADAKYSHAEGVGTIATGYNQGVSAEGTYNDTAPYSNTDFAIKTVGNGYWDDSAQKLYRSNALVVRNSGLIEGGITAETFTTKIKNNAVNEKVLTPYGWVKNQINEVNTDINKRATKDELASTQSALETEISTAKTDLATEIAKCTTKAELANTLANYVKDSELASILKAYVKAGDGEEVVTMTDHQYNSIEIKKNSFYIIQCYDSKGNLAKLTLIKRDSSSISTDFAAIITGGTFEEDRYAQLVLYQKTALTGYVGSTNEVVRVDPSSGNYLKFWKITGETIGGVISGGGGTYVEANPNDTATQDLETLKVGATTYNIPTGGGTIVVANPTTDATDDLEKITIGNKTYFVGTGGSGSGMTTLYRHDVYVTATLKNSNLPVYGMRIYRTLYNASKYSIDTLSGVFPYGQDFAVQGFLTDEIAGIFDNNADFRIGPRIYYVSCGATHQKIYFTEQDITYDKDKQIVTKIEASGYFYLNSYYSPNFDMEGVVIYDKITAIPLNVSSADLAQTLELLNENTTTDSGVITTAENVKPFDEKNNLAWQMLMAKAEKFREANRLLGESELSNKSDDQTQKRAVVNKTDSDLAHQILLAKLASYKNAETVDEPTVVTSEENTVVVAENTAVDEYEVLVDGESIGTVESDKGE